jgi:hypothetical protein
LKVEVNEQPKKFHVALKDKWHPVFGHELKLGQYSFSIVATPKNIILSEATSGVKIFSIPMNIAIYTLTTTKEDTMSFYYEIGNKLKQIIENDSNFDSRLEELKKQSSDNLGEMPPIEDIDEEMILAGKSDVLH